MYRAEERLALGRHGRQEIGVRLPLVPLAVDSVVATEDRDATVLLVGPQRGAVGQRFGEDEQGASRTGIGVPERRVAVVDGWGGWEHGFVAAGDEQGAALALFYGGQLPDRAGEAAVDLAGDAAVEMRVARKAQHAVAIVRVEQWRILSVTVTVGADLERRRLHAKAIAILAGQVWMRHELVHKADHDRVVGQLLQRAADGRALVLGDGFGVAFQAVAEIAHFLDFVVDEHARNQEPALGIEDVFLLLCGFDDGFAVGVGAGQIHWLVVQVGAQVFVDDEGFAVGGCCHGKSTSFVGMRNAASRKRGIFGTITPVAVRPAGGQVDRANASCSGD